MRKTTILILILAVVTGFLVYLAVTNQSSEQQKPTITPTPTEAAKTVSLYFNPSYIDASTTSATQSIDLMVDTGGSSTSGVQAEIAYDPKELSNVVFTPDQDTTSLFGSNSSILLNTSDPTQGRISYAVTIPPTGKEVKGKGKIATITFNKNPNFVSNQTIIFFLDKSLATQSNQSKSILKETSPIIIVLKTAPTTAPVAPTSTQSAGQ